VEHNIELIDMLSRVRSTCTCVNPTQMRKKMKSSLFGAESKPSSAPKRQLLCPCHQTSARFAAVGEGAHGISDARTARSAHLCASAGRDASHRPCPAAGAVGQASEVSSAPNHYATLRFAGGFSRSASTSGSRSLGLAHGRTGCFGTTSGQPGWLNGDIPLRRGAGVLPCWCSASENVRCHEKDSAARTCGRWTVGVPGFCLQLNGVLL
jgi:hypothetical protein